jgi:hypothetical protein
MTNLYLTKIIFFWVNTRRLVKTENYPKEDNFNTMNQSESLKFKFIRYFYWDGTHRIKLTCQ